MADELDRLNQIRLDEDKSYDELAQMIGMKPGGALNRVLRRERKPAERTLHKIKKFLLKREEEAAAKAASVVTQPAQASRRGVRA